MTSLIVIGLAGALAAALPPGPQVSAGNGTLLAAQWQDPRMPPPGTGWPDRRHDGWGPPAPYLPPYGYAPPASQAPAMPPCVDTGSSAVVEGPRRPANRGAPLVAMPSNDCADLPNRNPGPQPYIGVDVQWGPLQGAEEGRPLPPGPRRRGS